MKRKKYASDISPEQFAEIEPLLRSVRKATKPTTVDLYEVLCAVLYLLRTGCQWRLEKNRRLWKNCERWLNISLQFVHLAFLVLLLRGS